MRKPPSYSILPSELAWLAQQISPFLRLGLISFACTSAGVLLGLLNPLILKLLIDQVLPKGRPVWLVLLIVLWFVSYQGKSVLSILGAYTTLKAAQGMGLRLRMRVLKHLDSLSADYYETMPVGSAIYPLKEPIEEIAYFGSDLLPSILRIALTSVFTVGAMLMLSVGLTATVLPLLPIFFACRRYFRARLRLAADSVQEGRVGYSNFLQEHIPSIIQIQLLGQEKRQERKAFSSLANNIRLDRSLFRTSSTFSLFNSLFLALAMSWVLGYGGWQVLSGGLSIGSLIAFYGFVTQLFEPVSSAADIYARLQKTFASIRQVRSILELSPSVTSPSGAPLIEDEFGDIELTCVTFGYRRRKEVLCIPSLRIASGNQIAITGENGAGKSTLGRLIARIYDPDSGMVRIAGQNLREVQVEDLRRYVCYLARDPTLFDGSSNDNLRFATKAASRDELERVLELVGLSGSGPNVRFDAEKDIGPNGCQLSGGERQRLAIARALLKQPRILIFDEATSCLDPLSEENILSGVHAHLPQSTILVISHRPGTLLRFDRLLVLSAGRIAYDGPSQGFVSAHYLNAPVICPVGSPADFSSSSS